VNDADRAAARQSPTASPSIDSSEPVVVREPKREPLVPPPPPPPPPAPELPRGGRAVFPTFRLVGYCGLPGAPTLGRLTGDLDAAAGQIEAEAARYAAGRAVLPVFELIATVAHRSPGPDGMFRGRVDDATIQTYLDAARRHKALLLLNIQPGRADFLPEVQAYERWLREPDVGVALDPEWAVEPGQVPGDVFGVTSGTELDSVAAYLSGLVAAGNLPEKVLVFHQVAARIVQDGQSLQPKPGVVLIRSVDGIGSAGAKTKTFNTLVAGQPPHVHSGFKLFYEEDALRGPLMTPEQVLALVPQPEYVMFE
jgi:hypothetical protein